MLEVDLPTAEAGYAYSSSLKRVASGRKYVMSVEAVGISGRPYCAFFGVNLFDAENKRIGKIIRWLNDFSGEKKEFLIIFEPPAECKNVRLIYRVNKDSLVKTPCHYSILEPELIRFADGYSGMDNSYDEFISESQEKARKASSSEPRQENKIIQDVNLEIEAAKAAEKLIFPKANTPKVSIIILNYNKGGYTFNCLSSVLRNTEPGTYEVILVDNGSTEDESKQILKRLENIKILTPNENLGFIRGNNYASKNAAGEYLLFLNNDTIVLKGWLDTLLRTFDRYPNVGAVGSKFVYPNGTLQEAGSMIWNDGSARGYGRNAENPNSPEYHFVREVDFCSGASLIIRKDLFIEVGGLNEYYVPAYFEDVDLCFSVRRKGYKVMYNPFSVVVHYEGVTSTRDVHNPTGVKRFELENRPKFVSLWKDELEKRIPALDANVIYARDLKKGPAILIVDGWVPEPDKSSGDNRSYSITKIFSQLGCRVTLYLANFRESKYADDLRELGVEVIPSSYITIDQLLNNRLGFYSFAVINTNRLSLTNSKHFFYQLKTNNPAIKVALHIDDLYGYCKIIKKATLNDGSDIQADDEVTKLLKDHSSDLLDSSEFVFVISKREEAIVNDLAKSPKAVIIPEMREPIPQKDFNGFGNRNNILYVGGFSHTPNLASAKILIHEIFPKVKAKIPDVKLYIVGNVPPPEFKELKDESIIVTGFVEDLSKFYGNAKVSACPIVAKGGVKGKIIEALNYCTPVVTSALGVEGTNLEDGQDILVASDSDEFANKIIELFKNEALWGKISRNGRKYFEQYNSTLTAQSVLSEFLKINDTSSHRSAVENITNKYQVDTPLAVLLLVYNERPDLQNMFPEVKRGQYNKLIDWAIKYGAIEDSQKAILSSYRNQFIAYMNQRTDTNSSSSSPTDEVNN